MSDPLSLVGACKKVVRQLFDIKHSFRDTPGALHALAIDCTTTSVVL